MPGLQTATYIVALVYMGLSIAFYLAFITGGLAMLRKVNKLEASVQEKMDIVRAIPYIGKRMFGAAKKK